MTPMTYHRMIRRNKLRGSYEWDVKNPPESYDHAEISGDLRRLENDSLDPQTLEYYELITGVQADDVKRVLDLFFSSSDGEEFCPKHVQSARELLLESAIESLSRIIGPVAPNCLDQCYCHGCKYEWNEAIDIIKEVR